VQQMQSPRQWPQQQPQQQPQQPVVMPPPPPERKRRFRWELVWVVGAVLFAVWFVSGIEPAGTWDELMEWLDVQNKPRYSKLAVAGLVAVVVVLLARILGYPRKEK